MSDQHTSVTIGTAYYLPTGMKLLPTFISGVVGRTIDLDNLTQDILNGSTKFNYDAFEHFAKKTLEINFQLFSDYLHEKWKINKKVGIKIDIKGVMAKPAKSTHTYSRYGTNPNNTKYDNLMASSYTTVCINFLVPSASGGSYGFEFGLITSSDRKTKSYNKNYLAYGQEYRIHTKYLNDGSFMRRLAESMEEHKSQLIKFCSDSLLVTKLHSISTSQLKIAKSVITESTVAFKPKSDEISMESDKNGNITVTITKTVRIPFNTYKDNVTDVINDKLQTEFGLPPGLIDLSSF